jgi:hypothetical protein
MVGNKEMHDNMEKHLLMLPRHKKVPIQEDLQTLLRKERGMVSNEVHGKRQQ